MAVTALLVFSRPTHMRYLLTQDGAAGTTLSITTTGAATPDIRTDSVPGLLRILSRAAVDGFGPVPAGVITAAQSAALWESLHADPGGVVMPPPDGDKTAILQLTPRSGVITNAWLAIATAAANNAVINLTAQAAATTCWLDIIIPRRLPSLRGLT